MNNNNWGMSLLGAILLLAVAGGLYISWEVNKATRQAEATAAATKAAANAAQVERDLRAFAETHLGELQKLMDEIQDEIQIRKRKLELLAEEMRRVNAVPQADTDYRKWNKAIAELETRLNGLLTERRDTFVALKKFELNPDNKPELATQREDRLKAARVVAAHTREQFNDLRNANRPPETPTVSVSKDAPREKGKAKTEAAPQKKSRWFFW